MKRVLQNLGLMLIGIVIGLVLAEGLVRFILAVAPASPDSIYLPDPDTGYRLRPDPPEVFERDPEYYTNSFGFRDRDHPVEKPEGTFRILGIGDSFVYSDVPHLDDHFLRVAAANLAAQMPRDSIDVEMILMGVGGYSPEQYVGLLRSRGLSLDPDFVVLNFYVGNDVTGIPKRGKVYRGQVYVVGSQYRWLDLLRRSHLFLVAERTLLPRLRGKILRWYLERWKKQDAPKDGIVEKEPEAPEEDDTLPKLTEWHLHAHRKDMPVYSRQPDALMRKLWKKSEGFLLEFDRLCDDAGIPWALNLIPADIQIDPDLRRFVLARLAFSESDYDFDAPQRRLARFVEDLGVHVVDPLETMRSLHSPDARLYRDADIHWNARGHRIAGETLGEFLSANRRLIMR